jgi:hypothetical protein
MKKPNMDTIPPKVVVEWLTILHAIREIHGSNIDLETGYPDCFRGIPQSSKKNSGIVF